MAPLLRSLNACLLYTCAECWKGTPFVLPEGEWFKA
jgi:hypothetical protein